MKGDIDSAKADYTTALGITVADANSKGPSRPKSQTRRVQ